MRKRIAQTKTRKRVSSEETETVSEGFDNVFEAMGLPNAKERLAKAEIARIIRQRVKLNGWTGVRTAKELEIAPSDASDLLRGKLARFSQERLERFLTDLDFNVRIVISPMKKSQEYAIISVEYVGVQRLR
jgi:predicted XRE-type DNA-binding protein